MGAVIDCDQHLFETASLWRDYIDPARRDDALRLVDDTLGYTWLTWRDTRIMPALHQVPGDTETIGRQMRQLRAGQPAECSYAEMVPAAYEQPADRIAQLDVMGTDCALLFPNYGLAWELVLEHDLGAQQANQGAWNRWATEVAAEGKGRLLPVGHLTLRDLDWLERQLQSLQAGGVRAAMIAPSLVDGSPLSHPSLDRAWQLFVDHEVTPVFHVSSFRRPFDDAWYTDDPDDGNPVLSSVFLGTAPALALADLAVHGVFDRHPDLRIGVIELSAVWVPMFLLNLDGGFEFHARFNGAPLTEMDLKPSEYITRQVRIAAFAYEGPARLIRQAGDLFMFCSDYPHSEGTADALGEYRRLSPGAGEPDDAPGLFGDNAAWLLRI